MDRAAAVRLMMTTAAKSAPEKTKMFIQNLAAGKPNTEKTTTIRYQTLPDGQFRSESDGPGLAENVNDVEDESRPIRYYDCFDSCSRCLAKRCSCTIPTRYVTSLLASLGFFFSFGIRCNMGVAMVQMVTFHNATQTDGNSTHWVKERLFDWSAEIQGLIDSSYFWGYMITQVPGGYLTSILPANRIFGCAITAAAFLNLFLPGACKLHYGAAMALRITQGLIEGVTYPACHGIWRYWAPPLERSKLATIAFCGSYAGAVVGLPLSSVLTQYLGWEACFYFYGALGCGWGVIWWFASHERPSTHPRISYAERTYIEESLGLADNRVIKFQHTPWKAIFTSMPVYAIIVANVCRSWTFYLLIINQTKYFTDVFDFPIASSGGLGGLPHLVMAMVVPLGGWLADHLRYKNILSTTAVRKIFNCGGFGLEATFMIVVAFSPAPETAIVCLVIAVGFSGFAISGFNVNHLDIAPRYASILMGISNGIGTLSGILCPFATSLITKNPATVKTSWRWVFLIAAIIHYIGVVFYAIFASGEKQPWANPIELQEEEAKDNLSKYGSVHGSLDSLRSRHASIDRRGSRQSDYDYSPAQPQLQPVEEATSSASMEESSDEEREAQNDDEAVSSTSDDSSGSGGPRYIIRHELVQPSVKPNS